MVPFAIVLGFCLVILWSLKLTKCYQFFLLAKFGQHVLAKCLSLFEPQRGERPWQNIRTMKVVVYRVVVDGSKSQHESFSQNSKCYLSFILEVVGFTNWLFYLLGFHKISWIICHGSLTFQPIALLACHKEGI